MPGDAFKKVQRGDKLRIPAAAYNAFIDTARDFQSRQRGDRGGQGAASQPTFRQSGIVRVRNISGADRDRFDVLGIDGPLVTPADNEQTFTNQVLLKGVVPSAGASHRGNFVVLLEPLKDGSIGQGCGSGFCPARVDVVHEGHHFADIQEGESGHLQSTAMSAAARIVWKESGSGVKWAIIHVGVASDAPLVVKVVSAASGGGKYLGRVWMPPGSDIAESGDLSAGELGDDPGADDCLILNMPEVGKSTHDLTDAGNTAQRYFLAKYLRQNAGGQMVVAINGFWFKDCT